MTVLYRIIVKVIFVTLISTLVANDVFPKRRGQMPRSDGGMRFAFPPYDCYITPVFYLYMEAFQKKPGGWFSRKKELAADERR
jgi:hypothetical protein